MVCTEGQWVSGQQEQETSECFQVALPLKMEDSLLELKLAVLDLANNVRPAFMSIESAGF